MHGAHPQPLPCAASEQDPSRHASPPHRRGRPLRIEDEHQMSRQAAASDRYTRALIEHENSTAERDLEWVDSLIAAERGVTDAGDSMTLQGRTT